MRARRIVGWVAVVMAAGCGGGSSFPPCNTDEDCAAGTHCVSGRGCDAVCHDDTECSEGETCDERGSCRAAVDAGARDAGAASDAGPRRDAAMSTDAGDAGACVDADGDGHASAACGGDDCDDTNARAFALLTGRLDADGDGYCTGEPMTFCTNGALATGYRASCTGDDACDDRADAHVNVIVYEDGDGDGHCAGAAMALCTDGSVPAGYASACPGGATDDCDDDASGFAHVDAYADVDGDGHCVGAAMTFCTDGGAPSGYASACPGGTTDDCDTDAGAWTTVSVYADADGDGHCVGSATTFCTDGSVPAGYASTCPGGATDDCDGDASGFAMISAYADADGDSHCTGPAQSFCTNGSVPAGYDASCDGATDDCDGDPSGWVVLVGAQDQDGDGHCSTALTELCTTGTYPSGWAAWCPYGTRDDCDLNPAGNILVTAYPDNDHDGHCASGSPTTFCTAGSPPAGYVTGCPYGTSDACDGSPSGWVLVAGYPDADGDGHCTTGTPTTFCNDGSMPAGYRASCPSGTRDDCDGSYGNYANTTCYLDGDGDGWCAAGAVSTQCTDGATCAAPWVTSCRPTDCDDGNGYVAESCDPYGETGPSVGHCCCGCCPCSQSNPYTTLTSFCAPGYSITSCDPSRINGGGPISASIYDAHHCALVQGCAGCEGSTAQLVVTCTPD